ncbi:MAG: NUDIX domain-containing protein [Bacillota bacterium]|nr:NUDIX domain-containing protein [Bacillota bacterium]
MAEMWDLYKRFGNTLEFVKTGQTIERGSRLPDGAFHQVVHVWIKNEIGEYLISQRSAEKSDPLRWEPTGGSVLAGETSEEAAIREVKEELGLDLKPGSGSLRLRGVRFFDGCNDFVDVWQFELPYKVIDKTCRCRKKK